MKNILLLAALACSGQLLAQSTQQITEPQVAVNALGQTVTTSLPSNFYLSTPVSEWETYDESTATEEPKEIRNNFEREGYLEAIHAKANDPVVQSEMGTKKMRAPIINFLGQSGSGFPPDPSGAAGPNHYVQAVNTIYRVYDKQGNPLTTSKSLSSLWPGSTNSGDPIVMYDRHADRWFISQFQSSPNQILIAISETNDPTGAFYAYEFNLSQFPDYPKYSIWWDGYYMTSNSNHTAVVFEREKMLAGDQNAQMVSLSLPSLNSGGFRSPLPADADGALPPDGTPCYFFNLEDNAFSGVSQDQIEIYEMTTDWVTTSNSQVVSSQQLSVPSFDAVFSGGFANISQPGTGQRLDAIQGVFMFRAQHMRWPLHNSMILSHAVDMGGNRAAVRWYELRDAHDGNWTVYQSGTYAPDNLSRWMSSAAMDEHGNIGMAYSVCDGSSVYPGIRYTGRWDGAPLGEMPLWEQTAIDGEGSQTVTDRYGDYSHLSLDPNGTTFWYTGEYIGQNGSRRTRIFSFDLSVELGVENEYYENLEMQIAYLDEGVKVSLDGIKGNEEVTIDLIGMDGRVIQNDMQVPVGNHVEKQFSTGGLSGGIYFVRVGNEHFQKAERIMII